MASQHRLNALFNLSRALSSSLDLEQVLRQFTLHAQDLIGASASAVSAWDRDRDVLLMLADYGNTVVADIAEVREELSLAELPATRRVLQAQRPETVHVSNLADDATERALLERHGYRSLLMLPMVSRGETIGLMEIVDVDERRWDAADLEFCQSLCDVVAAAVHNAMLNQQQRAAEQRYRALVENLPAITYIDQAGSGQPLYTSPQIAELMGVPVEEWLASPDGWAQRIHPEDREAATAAYDETVRSGRPYHHVYRVIDLHGQVRWFRDDAVALRDSQGVPTLIQGVLFDITREKHAEAALSASELRFRTLVEHVPVAIYVDALSGATIYNSPHNAVITGYGDEQWLAEPDLFTRIIHPDDRDRVLAGFEALRATGRPFWGDYRIVRPDGEVRWVRDEAVLVRDAQGAPVHVQGYLLDITERRHAEDALRVSQQRFREMLENVRLAAVTCAPDGRITFCNEYLAELSGWSRDELLGRSWIDVFTPAEEEELEMRARTAMQSGGVIAHYESTLVTRGGERRLFSWNNTLRRDAEGRVLGSASIGEDITDRRRTEQELQRLAYHDALTGLPNRILFHEHLDVALARAERTGRGAAVLYVDLDDFKLVNDSFGHSAGDELLCEVARRLRTATRSGDVVARQGGDEFLILVADVEVGDAEVELD
ncbi:MAG: PAS domain S-box protein, partial [Gaiellales bacterium]